MSSTNLSTKSAGVGLFAALVASLCCITPVFSLLAGIGGIAATFSWMEPLRPYLIAMTIGVLAFAWYQKLRPRTDEEIACACEPADEAKKPSFWQSKKFLGIVTVFALITLAFPSYSYLFYNQPTQQNIVADLQEENIKLATLKIDGMTCTSCEEHVKHAGLELKGVLEVDVSYKEGMAYVKYDEKLVTIDEIITAINTTGYKVVDTQVTNWSADNQLFKHVNYNTIEVTIKGMTCSGCEEHVKHEVNNLEGISEVNASFEKGNAVIKYNTDKVSEAQIEEAINKTGYTVVKPAKKN